MPVALGTLSPLIEFSKDIARDIQNCEFANLHSISIHKFIILGSISEYIVDSYFKTYGKDIGYPVLYKEASKLCNIASSLLFSSNYFVVNEFNGSLTVYYENAIFSYTLRCPVKDIIYEMVNNEYGDSIIYEDRCIYTNIVYNAIENCISTIDLFHGSIDITKSRKKINLSCETTEVRNFFRCFILNKFKENPEQTSAALQRFIGCDIKTIYSVRDKYRENPLITFDDLCEGPRGPKPEPFKKIPADVFASLLEALVGGPPSKSGISSFSSWSADAVIEFLKKNHNLVFTRKDVYYLFRRFEISSKVGKRMHPRRNTEEILNFVREKYAEICKEAKKKGAIIVFADETMVQQGYNQRGYAPIGERAWVEHSTEARHTEYSLFVVMGPNGLCEISVNEGAFDADAFQDCIRDLHKKYKNTKFMMILDNSKVHHARKITEWLKRIPNSYKYIELRYLPAYCPDLNPVEFLNNDYKAYLRKLRLVKVKDVLNATYDYIDSYVNGDKDKIKDKVQKFFQSKECRYSFDIFNQIFNDECELASNGNE